MIKLRSVQQLAPFVAAFALIPYALPQSAPGVVDRQAGKLVLNQPSDRELGPGQADVFTVEAAPGQFLRVVVEKKSVDVGIVVEDPEGTALDAADSSDGISGSVQATLITDRSAYRIRVRKSTRSAEMGRYRIELTDLRPPSEEEVEFSVREEIARANAGARAPQTRRRAMERFQHGASLCLTLKNGSNAAQCVLSIANSSDILGETQQTLDYYNQALPLLHASAKPIFEANALTSMGNVYLRLGQEQKAQGYYNQALAIKRPLGLEAYALGGIGETYAGLGEDQKAQEYYNRALRVLRSAGDRPTEARFLTIIGDKYAGLGENQKALGYYDQALLILRSLGDRRTEARLLGTIGLLHSRLWEKQKALDYFNLALAIARAMEDRSLEAKVLNVLGSLYSSLGMNQKALDNYSQALPQTRTVGDRAGEAGVLGSIARMHSRLGEPQKALDYYNQALLLVRALDDRSSEALLLSNIGWVYAGLGEKQKALDYYNQALPLRRAVKDRGGEANTLSNMGEVYADLGQTDKALEHYLSALQLGRAESDPHRQGDILNNLMRYWEAERNPALAVFFGKQAVNQHQQIRRSIQDLDQELQQSYLSTVSEHYRRLADLLVSQGRLPEAEQVLGLVKQDFGFADLTPEEAAHHKRYVEIADRLISLGAERGKLLARKSLTPADTARLDRLEKDFAIGNVEFEHFLGGLRRDFSAKTIR